MILALEGQVGGFICGARKESAIGSDLGGMIDTIRVNTGCP